MGVGGIWVGSGVGEGDGSSVGWSADSVGWECAVGVKEGAGVTVGPLGTGVTVGPMGVGVRVSVAVDREMEGMPKAGCDVGEGGSPRTSRATPGMFCTASTAAIPAVTRQIKTRETVTRIQRFLVVAIHSFWAGTERLTSPTTCSRAAIIPPVRPGRNLPSAERGVGH